MRTLSKPLAGTLAVTGLLALFVGISPHYSTVLWWHIRAGLFWMLPILALIVACFVLLAIAPGQTPLKAGRAGQLVAAVSIALGVGGLVASLCWVASTHGYLQARDYYASTTTSSDAAPTFGQRAPFNVAQAQARPNLGDVSGEVVDTTYLPERGGYSTLVQRRGSHLVGYEVVLDQTIPLAGGRGQGTTCRFDHRAGRRDGGWFGHNLARAINDRRRGVTYEHADLYAYCDGQTPIVVVPLKRQVGWLVVTERPAGVALYNGHTGKVTLRATAAGVPGPAYPLSLAAKQRQALTASGGYWDYRAGRSGYETSESDTNSGNTTEFVLPDTAAHQRSLYATMLTGRGSATAISALAVVDGQARDGRLAGLSVYRTRPEWVSPSAIESRIKADYQDLPNWQNQQVMEISPLDGGHWVATIGNGQNVLYRVHGSGDLRGEHPTCLLRADGTTIRCGSLADTDGNGVGTDYGTSTTPSVGAPTDLTTLSNAQLAALQRRVADEAARRLERTR